MPGSEPRRHCDTAATQAACGNGHADGAGKAVSLLAATGAPSRHAQRERRDRREIHAGRAHRGLHGAVRRIVEVHYWVYGDQQHLHGYQCWHAQGSLGSVSVYFAESDSVVAGGDPGAGDYDEPEPARPERPRAQRTGLRREPPRGIRNSRPSAQVESAGRSDGRPRRSPAREAQEWTQRRIALMTCTPTAPFAERKEGCSRIVL